MKRLLIVGCGDVALRAIPLLTQRYRVLALVRNPAKGEALRGLGVMPVLADLDDRSSVQRLAGLADVVLHLAPPPNVGMTDSRTQYLLAALSQGVLPARLVYVSTSGVYGDCAGEWVDETRAVHAQSARAQRRVDAEQQLRRWARRNSVCLTILRVPGIYAAERLPLQRLHLPCIQAVEDGYTNHIHADDLAWICVTSLRSTRSCRVYHACDNSQLKMGDYFDLLAEHFNLPRPPRITRAQAQQQLPESLLSFMNESRRLSNQRMLRELPVKLSYPTVADFLRTMSS